MYADYREIIGYVVQTEQLYMLCMGLLWGRPPQNTILKNHPSEIESN